ncbi:MAG: hypothetical protein ABI361_01755 [Nitrososphaera sp.]|jgi:hypothetical protein
MDAKTLLYSAIDRIGKDTIRSDLVMDFRLSDKYISRIIEECLARMDAEGVDALSEDICEGLLHFLLTALSIPSERKISVEGVDVDIVIPSAKVLRKSPDKALIIQVLRSHEPQSKETARLAAKIQPVAENIWYVENHPKRTDGFRTYSIYPGHHRFSRIIIDIMAFLDEKGVSGLKLVHG